MHRRLTARHSSTVSKPIREIMVECRSSVDTQEMIDSFKRDGVFRVPCTEPVFRKVIGWCEALKARNPEQEMVKNQLTQEVLWLKPTDYEQRYFDVPLEEQLDILKAAAHLEIHLLHHHACQAIAARIKGKPPAEVRRILRQRFDLTEADIAAIRARLPWLDPEVDFQDRPGPDEAFIAIPSKSLATIFAKLPREDLDRLQLVSRQFRDVILTSKQLAKDEGPLRVLREVQLGPTLDGHYIILIHESVEAVVCPDRVALANRLKFCTAEWLRFDHLKPTSDELLYALYPARAAWKMAIVDLSLHAFSSKAIFEFAFKKLLLCKGFFIAGDDPEGWISADFMRLPAVLGCNYLYMSHFAEGRSRYLEVSDIVEWLHRDDSKQYGGEQRRLDISARQLVEGVDALLEAVKTAFTSAQRPARYRLRIGTTQRLEKCVDLSNDTTDERMTIGQTGLSIIVVREFASEE